MRHQPIAIVQVNLVAHGLTAGTGTAHQISFPIATTGNGVTSTYAVASQASANAFKITLPNQANAGSTFSRNSGLCEVVYLKIHHNRILAERAHMSVVSQNEANNDLRHLLSIENRDDLMPPPPNLCTAVLRQSRGHQTASDRGRSPSCN